MARIAGQIARRARGGKAIGSSVSVCCRRGTGAVTSVARSDRSVKVAFWGKQTTCSCSPEPREVESRTKLVAFFTTETLFSFEWFVWLLERGPHLAKP